jgi:hypothetical protein
MPEASTDQLKQAVESDYGGTATFVQSVPIQEPFPGERMWNGTVTVFDLRRCPAGAFRAYAWSCERPDGEPDIVTALHTPVIVGPRQAIRAAIAAEADGG